MDIFDVRRLRLASLGISAGLGESPEDVVRHLGAVQAQDYGQSLWALGLRMGAAGVGASARIDDVEQAIADRRILRTWPMRGTIHFVPSEDAQWMLDLFAMRRPGWSVYRKAGLDEEIFTRASEVVVDALQGGGRLTRKELYDRLEHADIDISGTPHGGRGLHILGYLSLQGLICFGPRHGKQPTFVLLKEWVPDQRQLSRDVAFAELTKRYFTSHGPATVKDFAWWSGMNLTEAKATVEAVGSQLVSEVVDGETYWRAPGESAHSDVFGTHLLPAFDEYVVGYKDRRAILAKHHRTVTIIRDIVPSPTIVMNGLIVGTWKRTVAKNEIVVSFQEFEAFTSRQLKEFKNTVQRYGQFVNMPVSIQR